MIELFRAPEIQSINRKTHLYTPHTTDINLKIHLIQIYTLILNVSPLNVIDANIISTNTFKSSPLLQNNPSKYPLFSNQTSEK